MKIAYLAIIPMASLALLGCGSSSSETPAADAGPTTSDAQPDAQAPVDAGSEAGSDGGNSGAIAPSALTPKTWTWIPVDGNLCRDGSDTGFGVSLGTATDKLMIYLEGGGACFNALTCGMNPTTFGKKEFATQFTAAGATHANTGIFNRDFAPNPVKDWTFVYVPYCTGDVHAGNHRDVTVPNVTGKQQFVGYVNVGNDLKRIVPSFKGLTKVLLTGISAGGFGAASNYVQVAKAFGGVPVYQLDDSGPPMPDPYLARCLQTSQGTLWGLDKTILADCGSDCPDPGNYPLDFAKHVGKTYPNVPLGLIEATDDGVITQFFGFAGANGDCNGFQQVSGPTFTAGLTTIQNTLKGAGEFGSFIFTGTQHTSIGGDNTFQNESTNAADTLTGPDAGVSPEAGAADGGATIKLVDWITQLVDGTTSNVGP